MPDEAWLCKAEGERRGECGYRVPDGTSKGAAKSREGLLIKVQERDRAELVRKSGSEPAGE
jgi:hypothetical protein